MLDQKTEEKINNTWGQVRIRIHFYAIYDFLADYRMIPEFLLQHTLLCLWGASPQDLHKF